VERLRTPRRVFRLFGGLRRCRLRLFCSLPELVLFTGTVGTCANTVVVLVKMANSSDEVYIETCGKVENTSQGFPSFRQPQQVSTGSIVAAMFTETVGTCANSVVLVVLVFARRHFGSHVNTLITNQATMDLFACVFLAISSGMSVPGAPPNYPWLGELGNNAVCFLFRNRVLAIACMNAEKFGLIANCMELYHDSPWYDAETTMSLGRLVYDTAYHENHRCLVLQCSVLHLQRPCRSSSGGS